MEAPACSIPFPQLWWETNLSYHGRLWIGGKLRINRRSGMVLYGIGTPSLWFRVQVNVLMIFLLVSQWQGMKYFLGCKAWIIKPPSRIIPFLTSQLWIFMVHGFLFRSIILEVTSFSILLGLFSLNSFVFVCPLAYCEGKSALRTEASLYPNEWV